MVNIQTWVELPEGTALTKSVHVKVAVHLQVCVPVQVEEDGVGSGRQQGTGGEHCDVHTSLVIVAHQAAVHSSGQGQQAGDGQNGQVSATTQGYGWYWQKA